MDYAIIGDATGSLEDGILTLRVDLRPRPADGQDNGAASSSSQPGQDRRR